MHEQIVHLIHGPQEFDIIADGPEFAPLIFLTTPGLAPNSLRTFEELPGLSTRMIDAANRGVANLKTIWERADMHPILLIRTQFVILQRRASLSKTTAHKFQLYDFA